MLHFGIIGWPVAHSFSANYFNDLFARQQIEAEYSLYPLRQIEEFPALISRVAFSGMNVTMPYKQAVIPYLTDLDETAQEIGAVNVIRFDGEQRIGYNTDAIGFMEAIRPQLKETDKKALILGTGGAAKAVQYGLRKLGLETTMVSRHPKQGQYAYEQLQDILPEVQVIVNCTPLGMSPLLGQKPALPYRLLSSAQFLYDCIYNPAETPFLTEGKQHGCRTDNGMGMLYGQAKAAQQIWKINA